MSGGLTEFDNHYAIDEDRTRNVLAKIRERNHIIGFHPSFNSYNNPEQWKAERERLESVLHTSVKEGRQHYLRFEVPHTWEIWEKNNMACDSTLGYADREGFRCSVCYEFSVFNFLERKKLNLKESPLVVMESTFTYHQDITLERMVQRMEKLKQAVRKYKGDFVMLWHNSNLNHGDWLKMKGAYGAIVRRGGEA